MHFPCKANGPSPSQEIPRILWYPQYHCCFQNSPPFSLSWLKSIQSMPSWRSFVTSILILLFLVRLYWADQPVSRVPKMALRKTSLAHSIHCYTFLFLLSEQHLCIVKNMCLYIHTPDYVEIVYYLLLLANNTAGETFLYKSGTVRIVDWMFVIGVPAWRWLSE